MKVYDATEQAYKRGYEAGIREFKKRLKETKIKHGNDYIIYAENIDVVAKKLCEKDEIDKPESTAIKQEEQAYFSPEDVRKMSDKEVRLNYRAIMNSMENWG